VELESSFNSNDVRTAELKRSFATPCKRAGIEGFTFHDLRHTAINSWRLAGHDYFRIIAATGQNTLNFFRKYNPVSSRNSSLWWRRKSKIWTSTWTPLF
jgi:integrase